MNADRTHARRAAGGFSLLEVVIAVTLLGLVLSSVALVGDAGDRAYRTGMASSALESQHALTVERLVAELRMAGSSTVVLDPTPAAGLRYALAVGLSNGEVQWTPLRRLSLEYEIGELDDGLDNNGNGLADEGRLVLTEDVGGPGEEARVLTRWVAEYLAGETPNGLDDNANGLVDERGFAVEALGETLVLRLTLQKSMDDGRLLVRTSQTSANLRN